MSTLLKTKDAASRLCVSRKTLLRMTNDGRVPYVQVGQSRRYLLADVEAYIAANRQQKSLTSPDPPLVKGDVVNGVQTYGRKNIIADVDEFGRPFYRNSEDA